MRRLNEDAAPSDVRWIAFYGDSDALVQPTRSGRIDVPALNARNMLIPGMGHLGMLLSGDVVNQIIDELLNPPAAATSLPMFARWSRKARAGAPARAARRAAAS
jgi:hypothetical protein